MGMALTEFEAARVEMLVEAFLDRRRLPPELREKLDFGYRLEDRAVEIFEIRPDYRDKSVIVEGPVARAVYLQRTKEWRVYWHRADQKWHLYEPKSSVNSIEEFLELVDKDPHGCFWG